MIQGEDEEEEQPDSSGDQPEVLQRMEATFDGLLILQDHLLLFDQEVELPLHPSQATLSVIGHGQFRVGAKRDSMRVSCSEEVASWSFGYSWSIFAFAASWYD